MRAPSGGVMPIDDKWDLVDEFTIEQAACRWCEIEPGISWWGTQYDHPEVQAIAQLLEMAVRTGKMPADTDNVNSILGDYHKAIVSRADLRDLAESKGQKPAFLFPEERATPDEIRSATETRAQADAPKIRTRLRQFIEETASTKNPEKYTKADFLTDAKSFRSLGKCDRHLIIAGHGSGTAK